MAAGLMASATQVLPGVAGFAAETVRSSLIVASV